jgi:hypothetical protein
VADNYYSTRLDAFINSLAIGVAGGATAFMSAAAADGLLVGGLGFLVSAACFEFARPDSRAPARDEPDPLPRAREAGALLAGATALDWYSWHCPSSDNAVEGEN